MSYNLLGYLPAPACYGIFKSNFGDEDVTKSTAGMSMLMYMSVVGVIFMVIAHITRKIEPVVVPCNWTGITKKILIKNDA